MGIAPIFFWFARLTHARWSWLAGGCAHVVPGGAGKAGLPGVDGHYSGIQCIWQI